MLAKKGKYDPFGLNQRSVGRGSFSLDIGSSDFNAVETGAKMRKGYTALSSGFGQVGSAFGQMKRGFTVVRGKLDKNYEKKRVEDKIKGEWAKYDARHAKKPRIVK